MIVGFELQMWRESCNLWFTIMTHHYSCMFSICQELYHRCQIWVPKCIDIFMHLSLNLWRKIQRSWWICIGGQTKQRTLFLSHILEWIWQPLEIFQFLDRYWGNHNAGIEATCLSHGPTKLQRKGLFLLLTLGWADIIILHQQGGKMLQWACLSISLCELSYTVC